MASSILETFYILFDSDSKEVKQGAQEADRAVDKLEGKIKSTNKESDKLGSSFLSMARSAAAAVAAIISVRAVVGGILESADHADKLNELSNSLGINIEDLSAWGDAVKVSGGSSEGFISSIDALSTSMATMDAVGKSRVLPFFKQLGIEMLDAKGKARPVMELLPELADAFSKLSKQESRSFGRKLGLDQGTITLLQRGGAEVDELIKRQRELGVVTKEDGEIADEFNDQTDYTSMAFAQLYRSIGSLVLPALTKFFSGLESIAAWLRKNKNLVNGFFIALGGILVVYTQRALAAALATGGLTAALNLLGKNKIVLIILAIAAAFAVAYDDLMAFRQGSRSLTGDLLTWWANTVGKLTRFFDDLGTAISDIWEGIKQTIMDAIDAVVAAINDAKAMIGLGPDEDEIKVKITYDKADIEDYNRTMQGLGMGQAAIGEANYSPINSMTSGSVAAGNRGGNRTQQVSIGEINIETQATDAEGISYGIGKGLQTEFRQTMTSFDDGVAY